MHYTLILPQSRSYVCTAPSRSVASIPAPERHESSENPICFCLLRDTPSGAVSFDSASTKAITILTVSQPVNLTLAVMKTEYLSDDIVNDAGVTRKSCRVEIPAKSFSQPSKHATQPNFIRYAQGHRVLVSTIAVCILLIGAILSLYIADGRPRYERPYSDSFCKCCSLRSTCTSQLNNKQSTCEVSYQLSEAFQACDRSQYAEPLFWTAIG